MGDINPNVALRAEMTRYFQEVMGTEITRWEVSPDYPQLLLLRDIRGLLVQVRQFFPQEEIELSEMTRDSWSNAWKRLNYLRVNLQIEPLNRQLFLSDDPSIVCLGEIMYRSYSRPVKTEESNLFHREIIRTIRVLDMSHEQVRSQLKPDNASECARFLGFLLRNLQATEECFHSTVLDILSTVSSFINSEHVSCVLEYLEMANPKAVSSTILKNIAIIVHAFYSNKIIAGDIPLLLQMNTRLVQGLVQVFIYVLGIFKRQDPIGVVEDAYQALHIVLFLIDQLLHGDHLVLQQPALSSSINMNLLDCIHEMIQIYLEQPSPDFMNITEYDWLLALSIARTLYLNMWTEESKRVS